MDSSLSRWTKGVTWQVDLSIDKILLSQLPDEAEEVYDPTKEPLLLREFAEIGKVELGELIGSGLEPEKGKMSDNARKRWETFCNEFGPPLKRSPTSNDLSQCRVAAAHFGAIWEVWTALTSNDSMAWKNLLFTETEDEFTVYGYSLGTPPGDVPMPRDVNPDDRIKILLRHWIQVIVQAIWGWEYVKPPAAIPIVTLEGFRHGVFHFSALGAILSRFVDHMDSGTPIRVCQRPSCKRDFIPSRLDQIHCDRFCTQAHKQQRIRDQGRK